MPRFLLVGGLRISIYAFVNINSNV